MDITREQILEEIKRIKYLYKMKGVFRFGTERDPWKRSESNAEHLYGMMVLVDYFYPLVDEPMDRLRIMDLIMVHDMDEIEGGDIISYEKTDADREREKQAMQTALAAMPQHMVFDAPKLVQEYEQQNSRESQFVKAIDKIEPLIEIFDKYGKEIMLHNKTTVEQALQGKKSYVEKFPIIDLYLQTAVEEMHNQGFFYENS